MIKKKAASRIRLPKTASKISKIDFYFVTGFYHLCDICMGHDEHVL